MLGLACGLKQNLVIFESRQLTLHFLTSHITMARTKLPDKVARPPRIRRRPYTWDQVEAAVAAGTVPFIPEDIFKEFEQHVQHKGFQDALLYFWYHAEARLWAEWIVTADNYTQAKTRYTPTQAPTQAPTPATDVVTVHHEEPDTLVVGPNIIYNSGIAGRVKRRRRNPPRCLPTDYQ